MGLQGRKGTRRLAGFGAGLLVLSTLTAGSPSTSAVATPSLTVDPTSGEHPIPEQIYGINWAPERLRTALRLPVNRWGGNSTSQFNDQAGTYNTAKDWYYENEQPSEHDRMHLDRFVEGNRATGTESLVTVPMIGWVASPDSSKCAFSQAKYGPQDAHDQWRPDCGNGVRNGKPVTGNDPHDAAMPADSAWSGSMVRSLASTFGRADGGGVAYYALDNEPSLWHETHRSVHPDPLTRAELFAKSIATAEAVKEADPSARVLGPSDWGYCAWLHAPADGGTTDACDSAGSDSPSLSAAYVRAFKTHADDHGGQRLLDYLDQHYYPQSPGVALANDPGSAATQALRLRSTRSLWDPGYKDESWIGNASHVNAPPLQFLRRMRNWADEYPGTETAITEYNFGGMNSMNGALAQADVLGIFGRERLDLASLWWNDDAPVANSPVEWAFRIYRNYDGRGSSFGSTSVDANSTDQGRLSVYAAKDGKDLTVVIVNKTNAATKAPLRLADYRPSLLADAYTLAAPKPRTITHRLVLMNSNGVTRTYPAQSVTLLRIRSK